MRRIRSKRITVVYAAAAIATLRCVVADAAVTIEHKGMGCAVAEQFAQLEAQLTPVDTVARARVFFRGQGPIWYSVAMTRAGNVYVGTLPKPQKSLGQFSYYVEAADKGMVTSRTPEYTARVVVDKGGCDKDFMGATATAASLVVEGPAGAASVPAGFSSSGVVPGVPAGAGGAAAGSGGGLGTGAIVAGGAVVVAGGAVAAQSALGGDGGSDNVSYDAFFGDGPAGIDVSTCRPGLYWGSQVIDAKPDGSFDNTWSPNEPGTLRLTGAINNTSLTASLSCVSGNGTGSMTASGSGGNLTGSWTFAGKSGPLTVTRKNN
jgi:hypothetical protein